ncbi:amidase [Solimonas sp. K1W22B-7]|uniref:amidase n=1 Tax=Solimonas sp. K1W22B-7 TaxID=2303331 RepID=UPI000E3367A7|nr:amidase [Solimonas sp. K1W22B-7]AXQ28861.1 amidase [Solimonas sp. K1W22B-7]
MISAADYARHDAVALAALVARGETTAAELLETAIARAAAVNPKINAINIPMHEIGRARAKEKLPGPLAGVPFLIKDIVQDYAGVPASSGCVPLRGWKPPTHASIVQRFLDAGLVIFGKTATPELALKGITESRCWGVTRNPWDLGRTPGGSSGGAAAAVAAGIVPMAGANDGGGSIRIPAACCGLFGLRPSRGRVPLGPRMGEAWEGANSDLVVSRSVRDSAAMLDALQGPDVGAPFEIRAPERPYLEELGREPGRLRVAFCTRSPLGMPVDPQHVEAVRKTAKLLESLGHHVEEAEPQIDGPQLARCFITMYMGNVAASVAEIRALTGCAESAFEPDTRVFAQAGRALAAGEYVRRRRLWNDFARSLGEFFGHYDLYLTPTLACPPVRIGELEQPAALRAAQQLVLGLRGGGLLLRSGMVEQIAIESLAKVPFTQLSNLTGTPSMSVPLYHTAEGLPLGLQFVAPFGEEGRLLRVAAQLEQALPWFDRMPAL